MPFVWRVEPLKLLKDCGYTTYKLRQDNVFSQSTIQKMRHNQIISLQELDTYCNLTGKSIGKIIEHVKELPKNSENA